MTTFRLPADLGGIEVREAGKRGDGRLILVPTADELAELDMEFCISEHLLTAVRPPLPEEPPNGTVISNGADAWIRCDDENGGGALWYLTGNKQAWTWKEMRPDIAGAEWKRYVPDPVASAAELPWEYFDEDRIRFGVQLHHDEPLVSFDSTCPRYYMPLADAEQMALAILRAAREAKGGES
jgi:hypothetical protein